MVKIQLRHLKIKPELKRALGLFDVTMAGVGIILGAGIYALIGIAAGIAGNATWLGFFISALIAILTGLSYAELTSMYRGDSGEDQYVNHAIGRKFALFVSYSIIAAGFISAAAVAIAFGGYLRGLVNIPILVGATLAVLLTSYINYKGIKETSKINIISTSVELIGLLFIIFLGFSSFGNVDYFNMPNGFTGVLSTAALVFFAYMGFESIIKLSEETKDPEKTIPKAIVLSILIASVIYILVAISAVSIIGWDTLAKSEAPLALAAQAVLGSKAFIVLAVIALVSTSNTVLITMVTTSRLIYGMAKEKGLPKFLSYVHKVNKTPSNAVWVLSAVTFLFVLFGNLEFVANLTNLFLFITFASVNLSLIILRYNNSKMKRKFKAPLNIGKFPVLAMLGFLSSLFMLGFVVYNLITGSGF